MINLIIVGAGALGREVYAIAKDVDSLTDTSISVKGFLDSNFDSIDKKHNIDAPVLGSENDIIIESDDRFVLAIGDPLIRDISAKALEEKGAKFETLIHPSAVISSGAQISQGCVLAHNTFIAIDSFLSEHVFLPGVTTAFEPINT